MSSKRLPGPPSPSPPCKIACIGDQEGTCCNPSKECSCITLPRTGILTCTCVDKDKR